MKKSVMNEIIKRTEVQVKSASLKTEALLWIKLGEMAIREGDIDLAIAVTVEKIDPITKQLDELEKQLEEEEVKLFEELNECLTDNELQGIEELKKVLNTLFN